MADGVANTERLALGEFVVEVDAELVRDWLRVNELLGVLVGVKPGVQVVDGMDAALGVIEGVATMLAVPLGVIIDIPRLEVRTTRSQLDAPFRAVVAPHR